MSVVNFYWMYDSQDLWPYTHAKVCLATDTAVWLPISVYSVIRLYHEILFRRQSYNTVSKHLIVRSFFLLLIVYYNGSYDDSGRVIAKTFFSHSRICKQNTFKVNYWTIFTKWCILALCFELLCTNLTVNKNGTHPLSAIHFFFR